MKILNVRTNPLTRISGALIIDLHGPASGGGNHQRAYYPTTGRSFVSSQYFKSVEVNKLTPDQMKQAFGKSIEDVTGHAISGGSGVSTGMETFMAFNPVPELEGLQGPLSPLQSLNPLFTGWDYGLYEYGTYDIASKAFSPVPSSGKAGEDSMIVFEYDRPYMQHIKDTDPSRFLDWLIAKNLYPGVTIKTAGGTMKIPDMAKAYSGNAEQLTQLDKCYMLNHGYEWDAQNQAILYSGWPLPWTPNPDTAPISVGNTMELFIENPLQGPTAVQQDFRKWQMSNCLPYSLLDWINKNSNATFKIGGTDYKLQLGFGGTMRGMATVHFFLTTDTQPREIDAATVIESYQSVTDPSDYGDQQLPGYGENPLDMIKKAATA